jgi:hypothetical protein
MHLVRVILCSLFVLSAVPDFAAAQLELQPGDHVCLVGNELGERMQHHNYWETLLHQTYPRHNLVVRNLCFPGDEPFERIRSQNFGEPGVHLTHSEASVILYFFGFNESFAGEDGVARFREQMTRLVKETLQQKYNGKAAPRIALVSPIAFEDTGDPNLPDGTEHNARLKLYTDVLREVAAEAGVAFADVFTPTLGLFAETEQRLTLNGCHLNDDGYRLFAPMFVKALTGQTAKGPVNEQVLSEVSDKNFHWWHRYRAVNGFSIYGKRGEAGMDGAGKYRNREVMERERAILDQMTANRDQRIWKLTSGQDVAATVDDSNTLPFLEVKPMLVVRTTRIARPGNWVRSII